MLSKWVFVILVLLLFNSCLTQEQRKQKASEYINKGFKADEQGNYQEAIKCYNEALNLDSTNPLTYLNRGSAKQTIGDTVGAIIDYKKSFALDTTWEFPLFNLGMIYYSRYTIDTAILFFKKELKVNPNSLSAYIALAMSFFEFKRNYDSTLYYSKMVLVKYPLDKQQKNKNYVGASDLRHELIIPASYFYQGLCYKHLGDIEQAKKYLSLAAQGGSAEAQDSLNTLLK